MISSSMRERKVIAAFVAALIGAIFVSTPLRADKPTNTVVYSGQAIALKIDGIVNPTAGQITICDTGALPAAGGFLNVSQSNVNLHDGALTIEHVNAQASGSGPEASAE